MPQQGFDLRGHEGDFRVGKETAFVQSIPSRFQACAECIYRWVGRQTVADLVSETLDNITLCIPVHRTQHAPEQRIGAVGNVISWVTAGWQVVDMDMVALRTGHLRGVERRTIRIDVQDINQGLFYVTIRAHGGTEAKTNTRNSIRLIKPHVAKVRSNGAVVFIFRELREEEIGLDPELALFRHVLLIEGDVKV